jgi:hypothetical protein
VDNSFNSILQSVQIKHETITEYSFDKKKFHNDIFFNKFNAYSEYSNSGLLDLIVKNPKERSMQLNHYKRTCLVSHIEQNQWRLNNFRNFAVCQPHHYKGCDGYTPFYANINSELNPRLAGNLRGDWFVITLENSKEFSKRFRTFFNLNLNSNIIV